MRNFHNMKPRQACHGFLARCSLRQEICPVGAKAEYQPWFSQCWRWLWPAVLLPDHAASSHGSGAPQISNMGPTKPSRMKAMHQHKI